MISFEILSDTGEREYNEDYAGAETNGAANVFVLADGLGGHGGGDEASRLVAEYILKDFVQNGEVSQSYMKKSFEQAQKLLLEEQHRQNRTMEMKTTLAVLLADDHAFQWGYIGDSRIYYFKDRKLKLRTLDHSVPQMLVSAGKLPERKIRGHEDRNRLLRVMGVEWEQPQYELAAMQERTGKETFLLCSDGFWEWIRERDMQSALKRSSSPAEWLQKMKEIVCRNGKGKNMDNYSAIAVFCK